MVSKYDSEEKTSGKKANVRNVDLADTPLIVKKVEKYRKMSEKYRKDSDDAL